MDTRQKKHGVEISGHAFVVDGCCFDYDYENLTEDGQPGMKNLFVHCNWGENTERQGYFYGDAFELFYFDYFGMKYFPVLNSKN